MDARDPSVPRTQVGDLRPDGDTIRIAGRVRAVRRMRRTIFFDVEDWTGSVQVAAAAEGADIVDVVPHALVEVVGTLGRSDTGQPTVLANRWAVAAKDPAASETHELRTGRVRRGAKGVRELRAAQLLADTALRARVIERARIVRSVRDELANHAFLEVDTPVLTDERFAGSADLFAVHSTALRRELTMRGSMESHLKQLAVAGLERVFTVGPSFRNESEALIEFLMVEGVWAYASQSDALALLESVVRTVAARCDDGVVDAGARAALTRPWAVLNFCEVVSGHLGIDMHDPEVGADAVARGYRTLKGVLADGFVTPTFVNHFPVSLSPLARRCPHDPTVADRGYLFFRGHRLCEIVQEEHDSGQQRENFLAQEAAAGVTGRTNRSLLDALAMGCPPLAGFGLHINRLVAALTGMTRVSDVVPFPLTSSRIAR